MSLWIRILIFLASLIWLIKSADYFTEYSEKLGIIFGLSSFIIGATIVALGTSLPELISGIYAVTSGWLSEYVIDWAVGSNIANVLLVFGIWSILAKTLKVNKQLIDVDLPFFFISMAMFLFFARDGSITRQESLFLLAFIVIFIWYSIQSGEYHETAEDKLEEQEVRKEKKKVPIYLVVIIISMGILAVSAKFLIDSILNISEILGITSSLLTLSVVALWTSLPEVLTSMSAIRKGNHGIAIGNVFGSNTFNLTLITGIPAFFSPLAVSEFTQTYGFAFLIIVTLVAIFMTQDNKVQRREGISLLLLYAAFLAKLTAII